MIEPSKHLRLAIFTPEAGTNVTFVETESVPGKSLERLTVSKASSLMFVVVIVP